MAAACGCAEFLLISRLACRMSVAKTASSLGRAGIRKILDELQLVSVFSEGELDTIAAQLEAGGDAVLGSGALSVLPASARNAPPLGAGRREGAGDTEEMHRLYRRVEELESSLQSSANRNSELSHQIELLTISKNGLERQIQSLKEQLLEARREKDEAVRQDVVSGLQHELDMLRKRAIRNEQMENELEETRAKLADVQVVHANSADKIRILEMDKTYLSRENDRLSSLLHAATEEVHSLRKVKDDLFARLCDLKAKEYESRLATGDAASLQLEDALRRARDEMRSEMDRLRSDSREAVLRETQWLTDARDAALRELTEAKSLVREQASKLEELQLDQRKSQAVLEADLTELRSSYKIKAFELERAQLVAEELRKNLRHAQDSVEVLRQKLDASKEEYLRLRSQVDVLERQEAGRSHLAKEDAIAMQEVKLLRQQNEELQNDLSKLLAQRDTVGRLRSMIVSLVEPGYAPVEREAGAPSDAAPALDTKAACPDRSRRTLLSSGSRSASSTRSPEKASKAVDAAVVPIVFTNTG